MKAVKSVVYSFDSFTVDVAEGRLWRGGELVALTPKAFETLHVLLAHKGNVVNKDTLFDEVWKDTFVEESTLAQNISTLRKALGTLPDGKPFIETVPRRGYRFTADIKEIVGEDEIIVIRHQVRTKISTESLVKHQADSDIESISRNANKTGTTFRAKPLVAAALGCLLIGAMGLLYFLFRTAPLSATAFKQIRIEKLTSDGNINLVRISPDGKFIAVVEKRGDLTSMLLRQVDNAVSIEIVPPANRRFTGLSFASDQKSIYFTAYDNPFGPASSVVGRLYSVSTLGGPVQTIAEDVDSGISIAPDGKRFAFVRNLPADGKSRIVIRSIAAGEEKILAERSLQNGFSLSGLAWSPDGKTIAAIAPKSDFLFEVIGIDAGSGHETSLNSEAWQWIGFPTWLPDGSGLMVSAYNPGSHNQTDEIWVVPFPYGVPRRITGGTSGIYGISMTADASSIVAVKSQIVSGFWMADAAKPNAAVKIKDNLPDFSLTFPGADWAEGNRIVFGQTSNGNSDIWSIYSDGTHLSRLTTDDALDSQPVLSSDGSSVYFVSNRGGNRTLWSMRPDGSDQKRISADEGVASPSIAASGNEIYYSAVDPSLRRPVLRRLSLSGGDSVPLTRLVTLLPHVSPDGKFIACYYPDASPAATTALRVSILSAETGQLIRQFDAAFRENISPIIWVDNAAISYSKAEGNGSGIWKQPVAGGPPVSILESPNDRIMRFAWSTGGGKLFFEKGLAINDVILLAQTAQ